MYLSHLIFILHSFTYEFIIFGEPVTILTVIKASITLLYVTRGFKCSLGLNRLLVWPCRLKTSFPFGHLSSSVSAFQSHACSVYMCTYINVYMCEVLNGDTFSLAFHLCFRSFCCKKSISLRWINSTASSKRSNLNMNELLQFYIW